MRRLVQRFLVSRGLAVREARAVEKLLSSPVYAGLPKRPGNRLQSALYLLAECIDVLQLLASARTVEARDRLRRALDEAERITPDELIPAEAYVAAIDPLDGLTYVLASRLSEAEGDLESRDRYLSRAKALRDQAAREDEVMSLLLDSYLDEC